MQIAERLEAKITARGIDRVVLRHDLYCAVNRFELTGNEYEMTDLTRDQLIMYLVIIGAAPGDEVWRKVESVMGENLAE